MSSSTHQIAVKGVDKTGAAFQSIQARAVAAGRRISSVMGGAIAAAGAYLSIRSIKAGIDELSRLDDIAAKTSMNVNDLTKAVSGLQILGIKTDFEGFAKALMLMEKNTGKSGLSGFYSVVAEIGKIPDVAERGKEAMRVFGRSGLEFMPVINAAKEGTAALEGVIAAMKGVSSEAARAGDDIADGMKIATDHFKSWWLDAIGGVAQGLIGHLPSSFRQAMAIIMAYADYYIRSIGNMWDGFTRRISGFFDVFRASGGAIGAGISATWEKLFGSGGSWDDVWQTMKDAWNAPFEETEMELEEIDSRMEERAKKQLAAALDAAMKLDKNYGNATKTGAERQAEDKAGAAIGEAAAKAATRITNQLVMGGSNEARKLGMLGPQFQNEQKKTNQLLQKVVDNTAKTAENTDEDGLAVTDLE